MAAWVFKDTTNFVRYNLRKDGGPDGRSVGLFFRNVTALLFIGVMASSSKFKPERAPINLVPDGTQ